MFIAILGFGYQPPARNIKLVEEATSMLAEQNLGIAVGNVCGTFFMALETADRLGVQGVAVVDDSMSTKGLPASTRIDVVAADKKHDQIARLASAGLIVGGAEGTRKLSGKLVAAGHPVAAVKGSGGAVDDGSLSDLIPVFDSVEQAVNDVVNRLTANSFC
jgi:hypothetical protein